MKELVLRLYRDGLFVLTVGATVFSAWELANDEAPLWVNIAATAFAGIAAGFAGNSVRAKLNGN